MPDLDNIRVKISAMAQLALEMWRLTHQAFMEHDMDLLSRVLDEESRLNDMEKEITMALISLGRQAASEEEKLKIAVFTDVVGDLELIGDYCKDILERVQIKIEEKLLFSDEAVKEYDQLYRRTEDALDEIACAFRKGSLGLVKEVLRRERHIDSLVDEYRARHNQRLIDGVCSPLACNMFLNMLDFTAAVYYHAKKIARSLLKMQKETTIDE